MQMARLDHKSPAPPANPVRDAHSRHAISRRLGLLHPENHQNHAAGTSPVHPWSTLLVPATPLKRWAREWWSRWSRQIQLNTHVRTRIVIIFNNLFLYLKKGWTTWTTPKNPNVHAASLVPPHLDHPGPTRYHPELHGSFWHPPACGQLSARNLRTVEIFLELELLNGRNV